MIVYFLKAPTAAGAGRAAFELLSGSWPLNLTHGSYCPSFINHDADGGIPRNLLVRVPVRGLQEENYDD